MFTINNEYNLSSSSSSSSSSPQGIITLLSSFQSFPDVLPAVFFTFFLPSFFLFVFVPDG